MYWFSFVTLDIWLLVSLVYLFNKSGAMVVTSGPAETRYAKSKGALTYFFAFILVYAHMFDCYAIMYFFINIVRLSKLQS